MVSGSKIFEENVIISGNIYTSFINEVNVSLEYSNGIQNDEDVEIIGDLVMLLDFNICKRYDTFENWIFLDFRVESEGSRKRVCFELNEWNKFKYYFLRFTTRDTSDPPHVHAE